MSYDEGDRRGGEFTPHETRARWRVDDERDTAELAAELTSLDRYSEVSLAHAFVLQYGLHWRYVAERATWYEWTGERWARDRTLGVFDLARGLVRAYAGLAQEDEELPANKRLQVAMTVEQNRMVAAIERLARVDQRIAALPESFDAAPEALNTPAGIVNLRTGDLEPHNLEGMHALCTRVPPGDGSGYHSVEPEEAEGVLFHAFLDDITDGDAELQRFLQVALGMTITGDISWHGLLFFVGAGRNGKTTLLELVLWVIGDYGKVIPSETLLGDPRHQQHPTVIANLMGIRLAVASEVAEGSYLDEVRVKALTGDSRLTARFMRGDFFEFDRTHKLALVGNHRPQLRTVDVALRARIKLIPFRVDLTHRADPELPAKLRREGPAVLSWLIEGAREWFETRRLPDCAAVDAESAEYFASQSSFDQWIAERCITSDPEARERSSVLYRDFRGWKEKRGEHPPSQTRWSDQVARRFAKVRSDGVWFIGITLVQSSIDSS